MCAQVLVIAGLKGGVGRTSTAVNLAAMLALAGKKTLLVDLDPKGEATVGLGLERTTVADLQALVDPQRFLEATRPASRPEGLDVWPGGPGLEGIEGLLWARGPEGRDSVLRGALADARKRYQAIIVDGPTALGPLGRNTLAAADAILVPLSGGANIANAFLEASAAAARVRAPGTAPPLVFGIRVGLRREELLAPDPQLQDEHAQRVLEAPIAYDARVLAECRARGLPAFDHEPGSRLARSYLELTREIMERVLPAALPPPPPATDTARAAVEA
ncbi:ParA family protein [bacterium]|nr:ParA family protein [bacterium]